MDKFYRNDKRGKPKNTTPMRMCCINIDGVSEKSRFSLDKYTSEENFDIVAVQETRTTDKDKLKLTGMTTFSDNNNAKNRGATIFVKDDYLCSEISEISSLTKNLYP